MFNTDPFVLVVNNFWNAAYDRLFLRRFIANAEEALDRSAHPGRDVFGFRNVAYT